MRRDLLRGALVLALLGLLAGALIASPVGAAITKQKVGRIATRKANAVFDSRIGPATAGLQEAIHWAYVKADGSIQSQSGGISLQDNAFDGWYYLHFPTTVAGKAIVATPDYTTGFANSQIAANACGGTPAGIDCGAGTNTTSDVFVNTADSDGADANRGFFIGVIP